MSESASADRSDVERPIVSVRVQLGLFVSVLILVICAETARWVGAIESPLIGWSCGRNADWLPYLPWLLLAPLFWRIRSRTATTGTAPSPHLELRQAWMGALLVAASAFTASWYVGQSMNELPPAYHDEYSYQFQARTFLAGRLWFPSFEPQSELFDQMHVLNEGRFASRYFPGVGLWMAPFMAAGNPWLGHWVANATAAFLLFWAGREIGGNLVGLVAGLLFAVSPGIALFSDLLLSHHPTLVGLMLFLWAFLRMRRTGSLGCAVIAGIGLSYAMLCRPMTAFGVGLPFGACFAWWLFTGRGMGTGSRDEPSSVDRRRRFKIGAALGAPIVVGLIATCSYNRALTGNPWTTPYQLYTDTYTPRHTYGFNNVERGEQRLGPKVLEHYDIWAENLDGALACRNVWRRTTASLRWTIGIVPLLAAALQLLFSRAGRSRNLWLVVAAIISLHLVHVPYWFEGIMGWHYVFESAPFWLLLFAVATRQLWTSWSDTQRYGMIAWWIGLIGIAVVTNLFTVRPLWPGRLPTGIAEVSFSRMRYAAFEQAVDQIAGERRIILFVESDPADRHIDYVVNTPSLDAQVLYARFRPGQTNLDQARALFPDRDAWLYRAATQDWVPVARSNQQ